MLSWLSASQESQTCYPSMHSADKLSQHISHLYLQWNSNHTITSKYSVVGTLHHRAEVICSSPELLQQEEKHLHQALTKCKYPEWALNRAKVKAKANKTRRQNSNTSNNVTSISQRPYMVKPYYKGLSESLKKICGKHGVQVYFKGGNTIINILVAPKDQGPILKKSGVIYRHMCGRVNNNISKKIGNNICLTIK